MRERSNEDLFLLLGRIDGKVDALLDRQEKVEGRLDGFSTRVQSLEDTRLRYGAMAHAGKVLWIGVGAVLVFIKDISGVFR